MNDAKYARRVELRARRHAALNERVVVRRARRRPCDQCGLFFEADELFNEGERGWVCGGCI